MTNAERRFLTRREALALGVGAFVVASIPFALRRGKAVARRTVPLMGTLADLAVVHEDEGTAQAALAAALDRLSFVEGAMTRYHDASDVGRANLAAGGEPVAVRPETAEVLREAILWAATSEGAFDPCLGRACALWEVTERTEPPAGPVVRRLAHRRLFRALDVDVRRGTEVVRLGDADAALDLGGIAKGYGVDLAVKALREHGIRSALVNVGGDLFALGASEDGDPWRVGIRHPSDPDRLAGALDVEDQAVATSGDYERYFRHGGRRYHHLLDPETAAPRETDVHSVTVVASTCTLADAAATTAFVLPAGPAERVLAARAPGARIVRA